MGLPLKTIWPVPQRDSNGCAPRSGVRMKLLFGLCFICLLGTACDTPIVQEKSAKIHYESDSQSRDPNWDLKWRTDFRDWEPGEYKDCGTGNFPADEQLTNLICGNTTLDDEGKVFLVRFVGALTYDRNEKQGTVHNWRCQRTTGLNVAFVCAAIIPHQ